tara:strand:- start:147 stop:392 length:246 start_codon:yes stop_codon:yes gene_type:complete
MDLAEIKSNIIEIIKIMKELPEFDESIKMIKDGLIDSFDIMNLITDLQEKFQITIDGEDLIPENFEKVDNLAEMVRRKLEK